MTDEQGNGVDWPKKFESDGTELVRLRIQTDTYPPQARALAIIWLAERDTTKQALRDKESRETLVKARGAMIAAWVGVAITIVELAVSVYGTLISTNVK